MLSIFSILFPVFALILVGFISRRVGILGPNAAGELSRFVVWLALPALLFDIMAKSDWQTMFKPDFILVYIIGSFAVFGLVLLWRLKQGCPLADASVDSVAASYSNTGYIGFPLMLLIFGSVSEVPTAIASVIVVTLLFGGAIVLIESVIHAQLVWYLRLWNVLLAVFKNPLVIAPIAGTLFALTPYELPKSVDSFLSILAGAASPAALVSLGLFLASAKQVERTSSHSVSQTAWGLTIAKLIVQPLLVAWLALGVFDMDRELAWMAIMLAALPTGTGPYMLAEYYQRDAMITAKTVLYSTVISLATLSLLLGLMPSV